jgi:ABC-type antimicrobial peptide transport system permease subunit
MLLLFDTLGEILRTLWAHKLRSFLTMFGIAWGVGSLLLLVGLGEGFRSGNKRSFDNPDDGIASPILTTSISRKLRMFVPQAQSSSAKTSAPLANIPAETEWLWASNRSLTGFATSRSSRVDG